MPAEENQTSSEPRPHVKVTYLERQKKPIGMSADNVAGPSKPSSTSLRKAPGPAKSRPDAVFKTPEKPIRIVDFRGDTSPKQMHTDSTAEKTSLTNKKTIRHNRSSSSIVNGGNSVPSGASPSIKPASVASRISQSTNRSQTPASETNNDNLSVADSIADSGSVSTGRIKRTESERKQYFENQSECGSIETHRAFCTRCKEWVRLSTRQTYYVKPWEMHRVKCDQKLPMEPTYKDLGLVAGIPFVIPRTEKNRKALLELDDTAETIEPNQIKCRTCQQWVPLEKKYSIRCWTRHEASCHNNLKPADIEKLLERKLFFMCDKQFKRFRDSHIVECAACGGDVLLKPEMEYDLDLWLEHKQTCRLSPDISPQPSTKPSTERDTRASVNTITFPSQPGSPSVPSLRQRQPQSMIAKPESNSERKPLSTADSDRTLVEPSPSASSIPPASSTLATSTSAPTPMLSASLKRKRDSAEEDTATVDAVGDVDVQDIRPATRARTRSYFPEDKDAPDGLGWVLLPFKAFVRGFKQSLTIPDS